MCKNEKDGYLLSGGVVGDSCHNFGVDGQVIRNPMVEVKVVTEIETEIQVNRLIDILQSTLYIFI